MSARRVPALLTLLAGSLSLGATPAASGYNQPPKEVLEVLHAPPPPEPMVSPTRERILLVSWVLFPSIAQVAEPFLKLAGVRVEPKTRRKHDTPGGYGVAPCALTASLVDVASSKETKVTLPAGGCADGFSWSADGTRFAFRNTSTDAVELWLGEAATGAVRRLGDARLNPMLGSSLQWMADQKTLLVKLVPEGAGAPPADDTAAIAPSIQETTGESGEFSTYEARDTLSSKHDEDLFDYYGSSQLALVDTATGAVTRVGKPAVFTEVEGAPDGEHLLVTTLRKPYSYAVTSDRFAHDVEVWNRKGEVRQVVAKLPVADRVPVRGVPVGPRDIGWRATSPATLVWAEALDKGDWAVKVPARDRVMSQRAPFKSAPVELTRTEQRFVGLEWAEQPGVALLREHDEDKHWMRTFVVNVDDPKARPSLLWDLSTDEQYKNPGNPMYRALPNGQWVVRQDGAAIFLRGQGATPEGDRPFLDRLDLKTRQRQRLFRSEKNALEYALSFTDAQGRSFLTWHQSPSEVPNAFLRTLGAPLPASSVKEGDATLASTTRAVTHIADPTPAVRAIKKRLVKYQRKDGTELSFTLYTPPGYKEGTRVPAILYAYPLDYAQAETAGQVSGSDQVFTRLFNYQLLLLAGYAIIDDAAFPIVGDPTRAYDTYLEQLADDAQAAVDKAVELGVVDRERTGRMRAFRRYFRVELATTATIGSMMHPEMVKGGYDERFAAATAASGGHRRYPSFRRRSFSSSTAFREIYRSRISLSAAFYPASDGRWDAACLLDRCPPHQRLGTPYQTGIRQGDPDGAGCLARVLRDWPGFLGNSIRASFLRLRPRP